MKIVDRKLPDGARAEGPGRDPKYPFAFMEPGQCLEIEVFKGEDGEGYRNTVSTAFRQWRKHNSHEWKVRVRLEDSDKEKGHKVIRAYRIA